jgi:hypothetical protein
MAAINKIYPAAQAIRLSLIPYKSQLELNNSFRPGQVNDPVTAVFDLLAGIHGKEENISNPSVRRPNGPNSGWAYKTVLGRDVESLYFTNRSNRQFGVGSVLATNNDEWLELQGAIHGAYVLLDPVSLLPYIVDPLFETFWLDSCGMFLYTGPLRGADNTVLVVPPTTDPATFANQWNTVKVPYDKSIGVNTEYVAFVPTSVVGEPDEFWLRKIGYITIDNNAMVDYWNYAWPTVVSR